MARITVEDCLTRENNRFALVQLAAKRTKQILQGSKILINDPRANKAVVTSLREIADGKVRFMTPEEIAHFKEQGIDPSTVGMPEPAPTPPPAFHSGQNGDSAIDKEIKEDLSTVLSPKEAPIDDDDDEDISEGAKADDSDDDDAEEGPADDSVSDEKGEF